MKRKIFILGAVLSCGIVAFSLHAAKGHPDMPTSTESRKCVPGNPCTTDQNGQKSDQQVPSRTQDEKNEKDHRILHMSSIQTYKGTVRSVARVRYPRSTQIEMILDTNTGEHHVLIGPSSYVDQSRVKVQAGDRVSVKGYEIGVNGQKMIMASEVEKNGNVLPLRDAKRNPAWHGRK